jgi:4,5-DOPA dioxygenase extradiol
MATAAIDLQTIHDFGPIDNRLFSLSYPAKGSPDLVEDVSDALGLADADLERIRGLDHGAWTVLMKAFPKANIPVVQLSLNMNLSPKDHYSLGVKLSLLRKAGYLIASSGNIVHNLSMMDWQSKGGAFEWASHFNKSIISAVLGQQHDQVLDYGLIEGSDKAVPHPDHFLPLLYTLGASQPDDPISIYTNEIVYRSLGMATLVFG